MVGAEYLRVETLTRLWGELDAAALGAMRAEAGGPAAWLAAQNPLWRQVGRVTFHLAENKRDAERPFAFLATYTHRLSEQAKPQYLPLGRALQEYAGAGNRAALLTLLAPVHRAAEQSTLARELVEAQRVLSHAVEVDPLNQPTLAMLMRGMLADGKTEEALERVERLLGMRKPPAELLARLARTLESDLYLFLPGRERGLGMMTEWLAERGRRG